MLAPLAPSLLSANDRARVRASTEEGEPSELAVELLDLAAPRRRRDLRKPTPAAVAFVTQLNKLPAEKSILNGREADLKCAGD